MTASPWADGPLALIPTPVFLTKKVLDVFSNYNRAVQSNTILQHDMFTKGASHMCMVHNSILRGYNSIYHQASHVAVGDKTDFVGYCLTWHKFLDTHAHNEENGLFQWVEELLQDKTIWQESNEEHSRSQSSCESHGTDELTGGLDEFMPGIDKFHEYLVSLKSPSDFSGAQLLEIMTSFQDSFEAHMRSEITTIAQLAQHARTPKMGSSEEKTTQANLESRQGKALLMSGPTDVMPFFLFNFDREYEQGLWKSWPPIPGLVRWGLMNVAKILHPGWWKFASCNAAGERKSLHAVS